MRLAIALGLVHAAVDAATVTAVYRVSGHDATTAVAFAWVVAYDLLAFGLQPAIGYLQDRRLSPRTGILTGLALAGAATLAAPGAASSTGAQLTVIALAGVGNAAFHLGAGAAVLRQGIEAATPVGLLVAPGALGLAVGAWFGRTPSAGPTALALVPVLLGTLVAVRCGKVPALTSVSWRPRRTDGLPATPAEAARSLGERVGIRPRHGVAIGAVGLLMGSIAVRSLVGTAAPRGFDAGPWLAVGVPAVAFAGKALGGVLADRLGWVRTTVTALLVSSPLLALTAPHPAVLLLGLLVFQLTMPVTLVAVARMMPGHLATGFGLTCLALVLGTLPATFGWGDALVARPVLGVWVLLSAAVAWFGLAGAGLRWRRS